MMTTEGMIGWILLGLSPILAFGMAMSVFKAVLGSRQTERLATNDGRNDGEYRSWRERLMARGKPDVVFCPFPLLEGELCYFYSYRVLLYVPVAFCLQREEDAGVVFDTGFGVSVGRGWSVFRHFGTVDFIGTGSLCVTNRHLYLKGIGIDLKIPMEDVWTVATACSNIMIGAQSMNWPLLIDAVNGQMVRDILYLLMNEAGLLDGGYDDSEKQDERLVPSGGRFRRN